jgi:alkylated DNA repair protein alkB homolog 8
MERVISKLVKMEETFDKSFYENRKYLQQSSKTLKLAVFGLIRQSTTGIKEFLSELQPNCVDFFNGQKPYFIAEFDCKRALQVYNDYNGKTILFEDRKCLIYLIPLNNSFSPDLPLRPLVGDQEISTSIPGLNYFGTHLSNSQQSEILLRLEDIDWTETLNRRKVIHFGYRFDYLTSTVDKSTLLPIPSWLSLRLKDCGPEFDQITINRYQPGEGIPIHCDTHSSFMDTMYIISLGSDIVMEFKNAASSVDILLKAGSRLKISGDARFGFDHGIKPRKVDVVDGMIQDRGVRYSITIRQTRNVACSCNFKLKCY